MIGLDGRWHPGSAGFDASVNASAIPISTYVLLKTIDPRDRACVEVFNQSAATIQVVRDLGDGTQATTILLAPGGAGAQGGSWKSVTFRGRVLIYGPTGSQVAAYED